MLDHCNITGFKRTQGGSVLKAIQINGLDGLMIFCIFDHQTLIIDRSVKLEFLIRNRARGGDDDNSQAKPEKQRQTNRRQEADCSTTLVD